MSQLQEKPYSAIDFVRSWASPRPSPGLHFPFAVEVKGKWLRGPKGSTGLWFWNLLSREDAAGILGTTE